jgi:hypothetical protein
MPAATVVRREVEAVQVVPYRIADQDPIQLFYQIRRP